MIGKQLVEGQPETASIADGWQQIMSEVLAQPTYVSPHEVTSYYRDALFPIERRQYREGATYDLDARVEVERKLRQAFPRALGSLAIPRLLEVAEENIANPRPIATQAALRDFVGFAGRTHGGRRAQLAHAAESNLRSACDATIAQVDAGHFAVLRQEFKRVTQNVKELSTEILDRDLGPGWREASPRSEDILSEDYRCGGKKITPRLKFLLSALNNSDELAASFGNAVKTGAESGSLGVAGMSHALSAAGHAPETWSAHMASRLRMLTLPAALPFWLGGQLADTHPDAIYVATNQPNGLPALRFADPRIQRYYETDQRAGCQGAAVEVCLAPDGPDRIRTAYQSIGRLARIGGAQLETDIRSQHIETAQMSSAMAASFVVLTTALGSF